MQVELLKLAPLIKMVVRLLLPQLLLIPLLTITQVAM